VSGSCVGGVCALNGRKKQAASIRIAACLKVRGINGSFMPRGTNNTGELFGMHTHGTPKKSNYFIKLK
jgi:hypothetical protein